MSHEWARGRILTAHGEALGTADERLLQEHLALCPECTQYRDEIERGLAAFRSEVVLADGALTGRTRALLRARAASLRSGHGGSWVPIAASVVACAALLQWWLLARDLVAWCHRLGMSMAVAVGLVGFVWLLWSALGAVATIVSFDRWPGAGPGWPPSGSTPDTEGGA